MVFSLYSDYWLPSNSLLVITSLICVFILLITLSDTDLLPTGPQNELSEIFSVNLPLYR